jgi:rod shape-determining protein MreC
MLKRNIQIFILFLMVALLLIFFKESQLFDFGFILRKLPHPQRVTNQLLDPPTDLDEAYKYLLIENSRLQSLAEENENLRSLLELKQAQDYELVTANIISHDALNKNLLIIDVGLERNIESGQAVVANEGIIIGKVIEVMDNAAVVRVLTDNLSKLAVSVGDQQAVAGLLEGSLGLSMSLQYIPQEIEIKKSDLVVTSHLNEQIPGGLVVGQVEEVEFSEGELFKQASVSPLINYQTLSLLAVIISL